MSVTIRMPYHLEKLTRTGDADEGMRRLGGRNPRGPLSIEMFVRGVASVRGRVSASHGCFSRRVALGRSLGILPSVNPFPLSMDNEELVLEQTYKEQHQPIYKPWRLKMAKQFYHCEVSNVIAEQRSTIHYIMTQTVHSF